MLLSIIPEEDIYMNIMTLMGEALEKYLLDDNIMSLIKLIHGLVQDAWLWLKEYT